MMTSLVLSTMIVAYPAPKPAEGPDKGPGYLGITFQAAEDDTILVTDIIPQGPASHSGLQPNDIIRKFNGEPIPFHLFAQRIVRVRPGTTVPIEVERGEKRVTLRIRIGARPENFPWPLPQQQPEQPELLPAEAPAP